jgi:hypothetical protein
VSKDAALELVEAEGADAFGAGVALEANPYPDGGGLAYRGRWARWRRGWRRAEWAADRANPFLAPVVDPAAGEGPMPWEGESRPTRREQRWGASRHGWHRRPR